jgi:protein gp37
LIKHNLEEVPSRLWIGATVGCKSSLWRVEELLEIPAATRWLSCEPLLEDLGEISLSDIHWVVGGGETKGRPCNVEDLISLKYQCDRQGVKYFCKQLGSKPYFKGKRLKLLSRSGGDIEEFPPELRVREFPKIKTGI